MRWGIFWKRLTSSLENNIIIIDGAFHLHNFLVDYRNKLATNAQELEVSNERNLFVEDICDNSIYNIVVSNDNNRGEGGRPTNDERYRRMNGLEIRELLRMQFANANMHRPTRDDIVYYDQSYHIRRIE